MEATEAFVTGRIGIRPQPTGITSPTKVYVAPPDLADGLPQRALYFDRGPYVVADGQPRGAPSLGCMATSVVHARSYTPYEGLRSPAEDLALGATARWFPDNSDINPRPDLGSDMYEWLPKWGAAASWRFHAASAPYVDPSYEYWASRSRLLSTQAMVFSGDQWMQSSLGSGVQEWAFLLVAILHHPLYSSWQDILSSPSSATDAHWATDCVLRYHNGVVQAYIGGKLAETSLHPPIDRQRPRPTIIGWSEGPKGGTLAVATAHGRYFHDYAHKNKPAGFDLRLFLANNGAFPDAEHAADLDLFEISYFDHRLTTAGFREKVRRLDNAYGVSGR